MGLLDSILGKVVSGKGGGVDSQVINAVVGMIGKQGSGGLSGIIDSLTKSGLGDIASSWVSTGANKAIAPDQIMKALGNSHVSEIASKLGISPETVSSTLAKVLPEVVDKLTPDGKLPTPDLLGQALNLMKGNLKL
jgi:uncharacterized protein YidB (DUF937 family)